MAGGSRNAVIAACLANGAIGVAKLVGFLFTGASSMLAEAIHSAADTGNQALLLFGEARSKRLPTTEHPFGYGRERYFWAFVVAVVLFALGSVFALIEGIHKFGNSEPLESIEVAVGVLLIAIVCEGWSFWTAIKVARPLLEGRTWTQFVKSTKSAELPVVLLEDLGAMCGLVIALVGLVLAWWTGNPRFDALGSMAIGVLLGVISVVLAIKMHSLLVGEAASDSVRQEIEQALWAAPGVQHLVHLKTLQLGPEELLIAAKIEFDSTLSFVTLTEHINAAETRVRELLPYPAQIFLEPDVYDPTRRRSKRKDSGFFHRIKLD